MAKKLSEIENLINESGGAFIKYMENSFSEPVLDLLNEISRHTSVYIFSGVIRNYFLNKADSRDLDLVLEDNIDITSLLNDKHYRINSFGGYKITIDDFNIDLWPLRDTWSLNNAQLNFDYQLEKYIPKTAFFNFSSILFSYNNESFFYTKHFLRFLRDKEIEMVYTPNPNKALCIVNTFYYAEKFKMKIGSKLKKHVKKIAINNLNDTIEVQKKHFGEILYSLDKLDSLIREL